jgi:hypothetical protein
MSQKKRKKSLEEACYTGRGSDMGQVKTINVDDMTSR